MQSSIPGLEQGKGVFPMLEFWGQTGVNGNSSVRYLSGVRYAHLPSPQGEEAPWGSGLTQGPLLLAPATWQLSGL